MYRTIVPIPYRPKKPILNMMIIAYIRVRRKYLCRYNFAMNPGDEFFWNFLIRIKAVKNPERTKKVSTARTALPIC